MTQRIAALVALRVGCFVLRRASDLLPESHREWGAALSAELESIPEPAARLRFAISGALGLGAVILRDAARGRVADAPLVAGALGIGLVAAVVDLSAASRAPAAALIAATCIALSACVARAAWRWPLLIGGMLPVMIAVSGRAGPYAFDRGDQWYAVGLAAVSTLIGLASRAVTLAARAAVRRRSAR